MIQDQTEHKIKVTVSDTGIGMSPEDAERVFDGFFATRNIDSKSLNPYGNGIGLHFCKEVCQFLGGDIEVESILGKGSVFTFTMRVGVADESWIEDVAEDEQSNSLSERFMEADLRPLSLKQTSPIIKF